MFKSLIFPFVRLFCFSALVQRIFYWLAESKDIHVNRHVAAMLGLIETAVKEAPGWVPWVTAGLIGLIATLAWELIAWKIRKSKQPEHAPIISMSVGESGPYFKTGGGVYDIQRTYNLMLENTAQKESFDECSIHIMEVTPQTDYEGPRLLQDGIALNAGAHTFIPLVTYGEPRDPEKYGRGDTFATMATANGRPTLDVGQQYTVTLRATAQNIEPCDLVCRIWVDENRRLRIEGV